jgi:tRNA threonylcarbamoyladenosine biosynthesis protein TsaE
MKEALLISLPTEADMLAFAGRLAQNITDSAMIHLHGPLGAGKTTFARGFLRGLGFHDKVKSPTYALVETYELADRNVFHFDLYRLTDANELENIGIEDYFSQTAICLIEWPEKGFPFLPPPDLACYIAFLQEGREIRLLAQSERGKEILERL